LARVCHECLDPSGFPDSSRTRRVIPKDRDSCDRSGRVGPRPWSDGVPSLIPKKHRSGSFNSVGTGVRPQHHLTALQNTAVEVSKGHRLKRAVIVDEKSVVQVIDLSFVQICAPPIDHHAVDVGPNKVQSL
jgi:hypothetical protein